MLAQVGFDEILGYPEVSGATSMENPADSGSFQDFRNAAG
jgi:hypothetical protein